MNDLYLGIDVHEKRGCCFAVLDDAGIVVESGWLDKPLEEGPKLAARLVAAGHRVSAGIDAPRQPLPAPREWYWNRSGSRWARREGERGHGRHCEIVVSAHKIGKPQWTPLEDAAPRWMKLGFALFSMIGKILPASAIHEAFPSASYVFPVKWHYRRSDHSRFFQLSQGSEGYTRCFGTGGNGTGIRRGERPGSGRRRRIGNDNTAPAHP
jgi:hypothetical protein